MKKHKIDGQGLKENDSQVLLSHKSSKNINKQKTVIRQATQTYAVMFGVFIILSAFLDRSWLKVFYLPSESSECYRFISVIILGCIIVALIHEIARLSSPSFDMFKKSFYKAIGELSFLNAIYLGLISTIAEELLFRVVLQFHFGIMWTSILLASLQFISRGRFSFSLFISVFLTNVTLGMIYAYTKSIYPSLCIHLCMSLFSLLSHSFRYKESS